MSGPSMQRAGVLLAPDASDPKQRLGVFNPASARDLAGRLYLFPRIAAEGNYSRIARGEVTRDVTGAPAGVAPLEVVLEPAEEWERNAATAGVEDPRITRIEMLNAWVMTYAAYGPLGSRIGLAISDDLLTWRRLGPVTFGYEPALRTDMNLYSNKDSMFFPEPVTGPDGQPSFALLHRPTFELWWLARDAGTPLPTGIDDARSGIWVSFVSVADVARDLRALTHVRGHRMVAGPEHDWEQVKIGAGAPPIRTEAGWLLVYHGVSGQTSYSWPQENVRYSAGVMLLDPSDVTVVLRRSRRPLLEPELPEEKTGVVSDVVFPTALDVRDDGSIDVFYGMADACIGVARLDPGGSTW